MKNLLYKELRLCLVPIVPLFYLFTLMLMIPSYPYTVAAFFIGNAIFNMFMQSSINNDIGFTAMLPVSKADAVRSRVLFVVLIQLGMALLTVPMILLRSALYDLSNPAGCDAGLTLLSGFFVVFAVFNLSFIPGFYKTPEKVSRHFLTSTIAVFVCIFLFEGVFIAAEAAGQYVGFFGWIEDHLDCFPQTASAWIAQIIALLIGVGIYAVGTAAACRRSISNFENVAL